MIRLIPQSNSYFKWIIYLWFLFRFILLWLKKKNPDKVVLLLTEIRSHQQTVIKLWIPIYWFIFSKTFVFVKLFHHKKLGKVMEILRLISSQKQGSSYLKLLARSNGATKVLNIDTVWKASKYEVFPGPYFPVFGLNSYIYSVNLRIQSKYSNIGTRENFVFGPFTRSVISTKHTKLVPFLIRNKIQNQFQLTSINISLTLGSYKS